MRGGGEAGEGQLSLKAGQCLQQRACHLPRLGLGLALGYHASGKGARQRVSEPARGSSFTERLLRADRGVRVRKTSRRDLHAVLAAGADSVASVSDHGARLAHMLLLAVNPVPCAAHMACGRACAGRERCGQVPGLVCVRQQLRRTRVCGYAGASSRAAAQPGGCGFVIGTPLLPGLRGHLTQRPRASRLQASVPLRGSVLVSLRCMCICFHTQSMTDTMCAVYCAAQPWPARQPQHYCHRRLRFTRTARPAGRYVSRQAV